MKTAVPTAKSDLQADSARTQLVQAKSGTETDTALVDRRSSVLAQQKRQHMANNSRQATQLKAHLSMMATSPQAMQMRTMAQMMRGDEKEIMSPLAENDAPQAVGAQTQLKDDAKSPNRTGLPDQLKSGIESLSGMSMDHVKVHYNSSQPAQLNAFAYAQGSDIHVGPGQEKHLPHEAWHVVQQAQGRVNPTMQMKDGMAVNDNTGLEAEADAMGAKAASMSVVSHGVLQPRSSVGHTAPFAKPAYVVQRYVAGEGGRKTSEHGRIVYRGRQDLLASPDLLRNANQQLESSGGQGSMISLAAGEPAEVGGQRLVAVNPRFNDVAYGRRAATERGVGFNERVRAPNVGAHADRELTLPADCRRAAEVITGTQTGFGYDERRVNVSLRHGNHALREKSALQVPGERVEGETTTHQLSMQVYVSSMKPFLFANHKEKLLDATVFTRAAFRAQVQDVAHPYRHLEDRPDVAWKAYSALTPAGKLQFAQFANINEFANPEVGDTYTTVTEYRMPGFENRRRPDGDRREIQPWTFHWGGVILKDGEDIVSLENYSVGEETAVNRDWQFDMYGTQTPAQTFHQRHMASNLHGTIGTTLHVQNVNTPHALRAFIASLTELQRLIGQAGFDAKNGEVMVVANGLNATYGVAADPAPAAHHAAVFARGVTEIRMATRLNRFWQLTGQFVAAIGAADFAQRATALDQLLATINAEYRESIRTPMQRAVAANTVNGQITAFRAAIPQLEALVGQDGYRAQLVILRQLHNAVPEAKRELIAADVERGAAVNTLHQQINAFRAAVPELEAVIGMDGYQAENERLTGLFNAIPEGRRHLVNAHVIRFRAAQAVHQQIIAFRAAIPQLEALAGQDGYGAQLGILRGLRDAIPVGNRGLIAVDLERIAAANTLHQQINAFRPAVSELEAVIGTDGYQAENERLTGLFNAIPEGRRNLVNAHVIRFRAAQTVHQQIIAFRAALPQLEALAGQDGYDVQFEILRGLRNAIPVPNRDLIAADMEIAGAANTLHQQINAFRTAVTTLETHIGTAEFEGQRVQLMPLHNAIPVEHRPLIAADIVRAQTAIASHNEIA